MGLTKHMIPHTNVECKWDWKQFRCEPSCSCTLNYKFGDYHLGRSCRFKEEIITKQKLKKHLNDNNNVFMNYDYCDENTNTEWVESNNIGARSIRYISNQLEKNKNNINFDFIKVEMNKIINFWMDSKTNVRNKVCTFVDEKD